MKSNKIMFNVFYTIQKVNIHSFRDNMTDIIGGSGISFFRVSVLNC